MSRMYDTKGSSLRFLEAGDIGLGDIDDLRNLEGWLDEFAPTSSATADVTRIMVAWNALDAAIGEANKDTLADIAYQLENGWSPEEAIRQALEHLSNTSRKT